MAGWVGARGNEGHGTSQPPSQASDFVPFKKPPCQTRVRGDRDPAAYPGLFAKYPTSIVGPEAPVIRPTDSRNLHYEGEMVLVVGKKAVNVPREGAGEYIFDVETIVSYVSRYVTLLPGDIIFTGTPGSTQAMEPGDWVEVKLEGVGILRNPIREKDGR